MNRICPNCKFSMVFKEWDEILREWYLKCGLCSHEFDVNGEKRKIPAWMEERILKRVYNDN